MADFNNVKIEPHLNLRIGKTNARKQGGDGGQVFLITEHLQGTGEITTNGGNGDIGGKGGKVHIQAKINDFTGKITADGGKGGEY